MAHGDVVNTASRMQSAAPVDGILVDERTYRGTALSDRLRARAQLHAKGKAEPVPVWAVAAPAGESAPTASRHPRPLVGAARELQVLVGMLDEVVLRREPRLVTLVGPPGIGKSAWSGSSSSTSSDGRR